MVKFKKKKKTRATTIALPYKKGPKKKKKKKILLYPIRITIQVSLFFHSLFSNLFHII